MKKAGVVIGAALSLKKIFDFTAASVQLAAQTEGVRAAFNRLNGVSLNKLREATRNTVGDLTLMQAAVRAENFKVPLDKLATFFEFATKRAAQTGESVDYLVNSIVDGIGRKSSMVLDNLGISATELQQEIKKVGDFGVAAGNIIERSLGAMGDVALTGAQQFDQLNVKVEQLQMEIGQKLLPFTKTWLETLANGVDIITSMFITSKEAGENSARNLIETAKAWPNQELAIKMVQERISDYDQQLSEVQDKMRLAGSRTNTKYFKDLQKDAEFLSGALGVLNQGMVMLTTPIKAVTKSAEELAEESKKLFAIWEKEGKMALIALEAKEAIDSLTEALFKNGEVFERTVGKYFARNISGEPIELFVIKNIDEEVEDFKQAFADIEKVVEQQNLIGTVKAEGARLSLVKEFTMKTEEERQAIIQEFYDSGLSDFAAFLAQKKQLAIDSEKAVQAEVRDIITRGAQDTAGELINLQRAQNAIQFQTEMQRIDQTNRAELDSLNNALNNKQISQQTYQEKVRQLEAETEEKRKQLRIEQAQQEKRLALAMASINIAAAVIKQGVTTPQAIATAIAGAVQLGLIAAQPIPTFHQGGVFGEDAGGKLTTGALRPDEGIAKLQVGERIIDRKNSRFYHPELEAISKGNFEQFMYQKYILPTLSGAGGGVMKHDVTARLHDANIVNNLRAIKKTEKKGFEMLASTLNQHSRRRAFLN